MIRKVYSHLMIFVFIIFLALISSAKPFNDRRRLDIHFNSMIIDSHNDTLTKVIDSRTWLPKIDISGTTDFHIDIGKLQAGGLNVPFFAAYTSGYYGNISRSISRTLALINALYWTEKNNSHVFKITTSVKEIKKAVGHDKIAAVPTIEGAYSLDEDNAIGLINQYYDLGIRMLGLTWNTSNDLGEGADRHYGDPEKTPSSGGLTKLGEEVVKEMNRLGMVVDVSHMAQSTFWDVINISKAPIMASHSAMYSLRNHQRNLNDAQLKALAKKGGVVGVVLYPEFLTYEGPSYIKDYVDHIDYAVNLIGIDHVGIGSDFDGARMPDDLKDSSQLYKITEELIRRSYSKKDIEKILGENTLRVLKEVEKAAENDPNKISQALTIKPSYEMGEVISNNRPKLRAELVIEKTSKIDGKDFTVILDGISYKPQYDKERSTISFKLTEALEERFHVVTFEATDSAGKICRETRIFYIDN